MSNSLPPNLSPLALAALLGQKPPVSPLVQALMDAEARMSQPNALASLFQPQKPMPPALGSRFGLARPPSLGAVAPALSEVRRPAVNPFTPKIRRVFYSFHYADIFRVNHVRKTGQFRRMDKMRLPTPQDRSLWEESKLQNPSALKGIIDKGLEGTSVTCVLAGRLTWERPWVRYEIAKSVQRGNGLVAVSIHNCECPRTGYATQGHNPLDQMAIGYDSQGRIRIWEWRDGKWQIFVRLGAPLGGWPKWLPIAQRGYVMQLSRGARLYDWITDYGAVNLLGWTELAAKSAGR